MLCSKPVRCCRLGSCAAARRDARRQHVWHAQGSKGVPFLSFCAGDHAACWLVRPNDAVVQPDDVEAAAAAALEAGAATAPGECGNPALDPLLTLLPHLQPPPRCLIHMRAGLSSLASSFLAQYAISMPVFVSPCARRSSYLCPRLAPCSAAHI